jgi:hypothetical protein
MNLKSLREELFEANLELVRQNRRSSGGFTTWIRWPRPPCWSPITRRFAGSVGHGCGTYRGSGRGTSAHGLPHLHSQV